jgi:hypothetical protein
MYRVRFYLPKERGAIIYCGITQLFLSLPIYFSRTISCRDTDYIYALPILPNSDPYTLHIQQLHKQTTTNPKPSFTAAYSSNNPQVYADHSIPRISLQLIRLLQNVVPSREIQRRMARRPQ